MTDHDTDPPPAVVIDRAALDMISDRLGSVEANQSILSRGLLKAQHDIADIKVAVLAIRAVTDSIPKAFHDMNNHLAGIKSNQDTLERLVTKASNEMGSIVTRQSQTEEAIREIRAEITLLEIHDGANGSMPPEE